MVETVCFFRNYASDVIILIWQLEMAAMDDIEEVRTVLTTDDILQHRVKPTPISGLLQATSSSSRQPERPATRYIA
jgi:hypothetical protein